MKLGLGLYRHQLNEDHYRFAKQCGCTHLVIHLVDYFRFSRSNQPGDQPVGDDTGWGLAGDPDQLWPYEELDVVKKEINAAGLELEAIENFDPAHWHNVLLDVPKKCSRSTILKPSSAMLAGRPSRFLATIFPSPELPVASEAGSRAARLGPWAWTARSTSRCQMEWSGTWFMTETPRRELCPRQLRNSFGRA